MASRGVTSGKSGSAPTLSETFQERAHLRPSARCGTTATPRGAAHEIDLGAGTLRFVAGAAPGQEGVVALDLHAVDRAAALRAAAARGLPHGPDWVRICGTTIRLV